MVAVSDFPPAGTQRHANATHSMGLVSPMTSRANKFGTFAVKAATTPAERFHGVFLLPVSPMIGDSGTRGPFPGGMYPWPWLR